MNRFVQYLNLVGVIALAALCVAQWQRNRTLNLEVNRLMKTEQDQTQKLTEQDKTMHGLTEDLAHFKTQFSLTHSNLTELRQGVRKFENENASLRQERDQLQGSVTNWAAAVAARDQRVEESNQRILSLTSNLNDSIRKFNGLATNYNSVVQQLNEARSRVEPRPAEQPSKNP